MPNSSTDKSFSHDHVVLDDGAVAFKCSDDEEKWTWLKLHPANNIVVQMMNYWCSVETGSARGTLDPDKWSALTQCSWRTFALAPNASHATHGVALPSADETAPSFNMIFFGADGGPVYRLNGAGVVFQTRDFESWRAKAKAKAALLPDPDGFAPASPDRLGVETPIECLVSDVHDIDGAQSVEALVTKENGFAPGHPYHGGSGDHVNAGHLLDTAQQAARILSGGRMTVCAGGEAAFRHYVELGRAFRITKAAEPAPDEIALTFHQGDQLCANVTMKFASL